MKDLKEIFNETAEILQDDNSEILTEGVVGKIGKVLLALVIGPYVVVGSVCLLGSLISSVIDGCKGLKNNKKLKNNKYVSSKWYISKFTDTDKFLDKITSIKYEKNIFNYLDECIKSDEKIINLYKKQMKLLLSDMKKVKLTGDNDKDYDLVDDVLSKANGYFGVPKSLLPKGYNLDKNKDKWVLDNDDTAKRKLKEFFNSCNNLETKKNEMLSVLNDIEKEYHRLHRGAEYGDMGEYIFADTNAMHLWDDSPICENYIKYLNYIEIKVG